MDRFAVELRAEVRDGTLAGHAAVFNTVAHVGGHYERLDRSAFEEALKTSDARFLVNHDPNMLLGRQGAGTLRLWTDDEGLAFEVDLPDTQVARDVRELVRRGDLDGGSFGFIPGADKWTRAEDGFQVRTHTSVKRLLDASVVTYPAYSGTEIQLRKMELAEVAPNGRGQLIVARHRRLTGGSTHGHR